MRGKSAVYPISAPSKENGHATLNGIGNGYGGKGHTNIGFYASPDEVQFTKPLEEVSPKVKEVDPWELTPMEEDEGPRFKDLSLGAKALSVVIVTVKLIAVVGLLYIFVCSLNFLSNAFRLIAGRTTGSVFRNDYMSNPVVGLMIGILVTVLVQSSSTSTSIIVSMVNSGILHVHAAVPMIMGSNIGTSVTNTIVSLTQVGDRSVFRRAFAGATVHDMFNWLSVIVLLSLEVATGLLERITLLLVESTDWSQVTGGKVKLLKVITDPFTNKIIQLDSKVLTAWSKNDPNFFNASLIKKFCKFETMSNGGKAGIPGSCNFIFADTYMQDTEVGLILLLVALVLLCLALILVVKILSSIVQGSIAHVIRVTLNADIPYVPWLTGYLAILIGALITVVVQSSSIFTSTLTPLIGLGLISVERSYPLTLGSNIGTTTTALLASIAGDGDGIKNSIQIALVHLFFNVFGLLLFYPVPFMRFPVPLAKGLGNITANYRWFAVLYLLLMFILLPAFVFILSLGGTLTLYIVGVPILVLLVLISIVNIIQNKRRHWLPSKLQNWDFVPLPLRSLQPYDRIFTSPPCCKSCRQEVPLGIVAVQGGPMTLHSVNVTNGDILHKGGNGEVKLVEARTFFPVGPVPPIENESFDTSGKRRRMDDASNGVANHALTVERLG